MTFKHIRQVSNQYEANPGSHLDACLDELRRLADGLDFGQSVSMKHNGSVYILTRKRVVHDDF
jgi:hypothetical protein